MADFNPSVQSNDECQRDWQDYDFDGFHADLGTMVPIKLFCHNTSRFWWMVYIKISVDSKKLLDVHKTCPKNYFPSKMKDFCIFTKIA